MNTKQAIDKALVKTRTAFIDDKVLRLQARTKAFNAQRGHKHPALLAPARRAKLRRS